LVDGTLYRGQLFANATIRNAVIDGYYKNGLDTHDVGEAVYRIAIDPKPKLRQSASSHLSYPRACGP